MSRSLLSRRAICTYKYSQLYGGRAALHVGRRLGPILCALSLRPFVVMWEVEVSRSFVGAQQSSHSRLSPAHHREAESCSQYEHPTYLSHGGCSCLAAWKGSRNCSPEVCYDEAYWCNGKRETLHDSATLCAANIAEALPRQRALQNYVPLRTSDRTCELIPCQKATL